MKKFTRIGACLVASLLLIAAVLCVGCSSDMYSEEKHMQRIRERAEERFLGEDSEYTGLEVYPIYNEYDELKYALIEFEPQGFVYVYISEREYPYFLSTELTVFIGLSHGLIPAVKRGEQYLDLVDGAMIDYTPGMESAYAIAEIGFINKANFDL